MSILITKPQKRLATGRVNTTGDNVVSNCLETVWGLSTRPKRKVADASTLSISTAKDSNQYDLPDPKPKKKRTKEQSAESRGLADIASFLEETDAEVSLLQGMVRQTVNELRDIVLRVKELYPLCWAHRLRLIQDLMLVS
ncbi:hypothetical protein EON65_27700 [archaeon]|nr:MAG: hypothetical protein EON65_27700 [archaeon]